MSFPQWKGLFDWSLKYQDGTRPSDWDPSEYDPAKMRWLESVLKHYMQDFTVRMQQIKTALDTGRVAPTGSEGDDTPDNRPQQDQGSLTLKDKEALLDELMDIVSSIDLARDLHKVGGLGTLLELLRCDEPSLSWRAAEVIATCVANNPPVQLWFLEGGALPPLLELMGGTGQEEQQVMQRVKALLALSGLVRHCQPALGALQQQGGVQKVAALAKDKDTRVKRKVFTLLHHLMTQHPCLASTLTTSGAVQAAVDTLQGPGTSSTTQSATSTSLVEGSDLRQAALELLNQVGQEPDGWDALHRCTQLVPYLEALQASLQALPADDQECCQDESHALTQLKDRISAPRPGVADAASGQTHSNPMGQQQAKPLLLM